MHNLAIDWLDENYIASCSSSSDPTVCIWDRRVGSRFVSPAVGPTHTPETGQPGPALEFKNVLAPKSSIWSLRFSRTKRGCLGVLSNTGHFKTYDIAKEYLSEEYRSSVDETLGQGSFENYPEPIYTKYVRDVRSPFNHPSRGCKESERIVSFDFLNISASNEPSAITLSGSGNVNITKLKPPASPIGLSSQGTLVCGGPCDGEFRTMEPQLSQGSSASGVVGTIRDRVQPDSNMQQAEGRRTLSSRQNRERALSLGTQGRRLSAEEALSLLTVSKLRCQEGYLFDEARNKRILADDPYLQDFWDWVKRGCIDRYGMSLTVLGERSDSSDQSFIMNNLDLNYLGVYGVWSNDLGTALALCCLPQLISAGKSLKNRRIDYSMEPIYINDTIVELARELNLPEMKCCETDYPEHRRLCLRLCGAVQTQSELEKLVRSLPAEGQHTKGAALAVFHGDTKLAYAALRSHEPTQAHKLLAMAIAGAAKGDADTDWEETCEEIAKELTDPYARGILALVSKGDWNSVIQETTLPLKYRVEVALRWFPDDDLTVYLREVTSEAVRHGDIEGIILTGLGHSAAMSLFQAYIKKFQDVQTPVLAMSHTVPRFLNDDRSKAQFEFWRETYRWQINSWKMQLQRARFDVASRGFAATWDGRRLTDPPRQQVSLSCNFCTRPLAQQDDASTQPGGGEVVHPTVGSPFGAAAMSGAVCPKCGRHMPRCGVCSLWLGSPDPMSKASVVADGGGPSEMELMRRFVVFCVGCNHGFHAHHAREWFGRHKVCPVAECGCICDR